MCVCLCRAASALRRVGKSGNFAVTGEGRSLLPPLAAGRPSGGAGPRGKAGGERRARCFAAGINLISLMPGCGSESETVTGAELHTLVLLLSVRAIVTLI